MHDEGGEAGGSSQSPVSPTADSSHTDASQGCAGHMKSGSPGAENRPRWNLCSMHQNSFLRFRKNHSVSVACQTDATEDFPTRSSSVCSKTASAEATSSNTADGVLRLMIQNFPNMNDTVRGPSKRINGVSWRIMVMPRQHVVQKKGTQKCLGFFLQCCPDAYSDSWSCQASAELRLISQKPGVMHFTRKTTHNYTAKENDWGYSCFMTWADILDENQGYIKEDKVVLEVAVKAEPPKQIVTLEEFKKTIKGWYDLAELHYSRGHIDRALEANAQGLKFCKDRDNACKERLEKQKSFFVEQKVVERIQHIEQKGNTVVAEDDANSQNALRMALTQTTTQKTNVAKGKTNKKATMTKKKTRAGTPTGQLDKKSECKEEKTWMDGNFSKSLLLQRRDREDSYTTFTKHICELTADPLALEDPETKDGLGYMFDQIGLFHVARLDYPNGKFHNTPLELELQRQLMVKKAVQFAEEYTARVARNEDLMSLECEDMEEVDISLLFKPNAESRMAERLDIVDRQAEFLDAKVRLFWNFIQLEDDCSFSDPASPCSSDSESANGDGPQMKRSRCEDEDGRACEHCALSNKFERLIIGPPLTADSHCQTDPVSCETYVVASDALHKKTEGNETTPIPTARQQKRPTAKAVSKKNNKGVQKATLGTQSEQKKESSKSSTVSPIGDMVDGTQFVQGMVVECTKCFMLDDDMEGFLRASMARVWTLVRGGDDKPTAGTNTSWDSFYTTYVGQMLPAQQIDLALSVIAICCLNAKKAEERLSAITQHIDKKIRNPDVQNALRTLCKLGDMVVVEDDEDSGSPLHEERRAGGEDYLLSCHLTRLDNLRQKAEKYTYYVHNKDAERLMQAVIAVEQKCTQMEKERAKLLRAIEEQKKETERAERNHARALGDLRAEKEAKDKVNNQLKEKNKEIKKHEKRIKELSAQVEEKDELKEHKDHLQKDLNAERRRAQDLDSRLKHEQHAREEQRRHLQSELSSRDQDYARVLQSNEELKAQLKKMEAQLAQEKRTSHTALSAQGERAKKAEMAYIKYLYETDARKLERAKEDAIKNMKDMEDAAANRSRTANEQQAFAASRDEWKAKSEEIMVLIHKAKNEYNSHMEALKSGKELSQLPTLTIAKPPPPCKILPIPPPQPVAPIEPPKPSPGVIGSRSTSSIGQLPTPIGSNISPKSKAPGSPIQKPVAAVASQPQMGSPARHPGAIGTRISNGGESVSVSGLGSAAPGSSSSGTGWHWNDYNFSDNILSTNRSLGSLTGEYGTSALTCTSSTVARDVPSSNGWNDDGWGQKTTSSTSGATLLTGLGTVSPTYGSLWEDRRPSQAPQAPQQANRYTLILEKLSECFPGVPNSRLVEWANDYCTHYKTNLSQEPIPAAVQLLQNHIVSKLKADAEASRRLLGTSIQPSHGVNPSYLNMGGLLGSEPSARQTPNQLMNTYNSFMEPSLLNGDTSRNVLGDKWSF